MISRIRGELSMIGEVHALVENGGLSYQILLPSALAERLKDNGRVGQEVSFETIYYIEAGDRKSSHYPRLVGFDDAPIASYTDPPLTTVRQPIYDLGVTAISLLLRLLEKETEGPLRTILTTELVIRASCGAQAQST